MRPTYRYITFFAILLLSACASMSLLWTTTSSSVLTILPTDDNTILVISSADEDSISITELNEGGDELETKAYPITLSDDGYGRYITYAQPNGSFFQIDSTLSEVIFVDFSNDTYWDLFDTSDIELQENQTAIVRGAFSVEEGLFIFGKVITEGIDTSSAFALVIDKEGSVTQLLKMDSLIEFYQGFRDTQGHIALQGTSHNEPQDDPTTQFLRQHVVSISPNGEILNQREVAYKTRLLGVSLAREITITSGILEINGQATTTDIGNKGYNFTGAVTDTQGNLYMFGDSIGGFYLQITLLQWLIKTDPEGNIVFTYEDDEHYFHETLTAPFIEENGDIRWRHKGLALKGFGAALSTSEEGGLTFNLGLISTLQWDTAFTTFSPNGDIKSEFIPPSGFKVTETDDYDNDDVNYVPGECWNTDTLYLEDRLVTLRAYCETDIFGSTKSLSIFR